LKPTNNKHPHTPTSNNQTTKHFYVQRIVVHATTTTTKHTPKNKPNQKPNPKQQSTQAIAQQQRNNNKETKKP
jgi:hypothetical protein